MAQPIHCDIQGGEPHLADVLVSMIANGDSSAWCFTHYLDVCQSVLETAQEAAAQAAATDQDAVARLEEVTAPAGADMDQEPDQAAPTAPADPAGPDGGPGGPAGDQPEPEGLAGSDADQGQEDPAAAATA